ncbi:MAG: NAD(P)-dependent oxidoreductase [Fimbriimonadaceae bacterium]|nr:NAD(P)-dependent oxidoreductase [Fimbriimonadaceae bacterium]QYK58371.1 MAG: NAD(P)-dependent oxidoreductase [Fimbriimonadaceae bacterium]
MARVGFVGLGVMGAPMAGHLVDHGHQVTVWNRTPGKSEPLAARGARAAASLPELAADCEVVCLCVGRSEDVAECVALIAPNAVPGALIVDHSTIAPTVAQTLHAELAQSGLGFVDAPVTGGSMGAQTGQLTVFCGGSEEDYARAKPVVEAYAKRIAYVGGPGAGQTMKLANQIAVGGALLGLCESLAFAHRAGLDLALTRELLSGGAAGSWAFDNYGPKILERDWSPGFSVKNQRKDFGYVLESAEGLRAAVPGTALVDLLLAKLEEAGHGEWATAALFEVLAEGTQA